MVAQASIQMKSWDEDQEANLYFVYLFSLLVLEHKMVSKLPQSVLLALKVHLQNLDFWSV